MSLYTRIKERREALGLSQDELAMRLNYKSRSTIAKIESGANDIPQSKIKAFADALNTTTSYLMGWDDNEALLEPTITDKEKKLLSYYNQLNDLGKDKLIENAEDLTHNTKYSNVIELASTIEEENDYLMPIAAHNDNINDEQLEKMRRDIELIKQIKKK